MERRGRSSPGLAMLALLIAGQLISLIGSGMTRFGLGVWVYQQTGSVTQLALLPLSISLATVVCSPFAGVLIDRWGARAALIASNLGAGCCSLMIALLLLGDRLTTPAIYGLALVGAGFSAVQWPASNTVITVLVPKQHFARASGIVQIAQSLGQIAAPSLASLLITLIGFGSVVLIDVVSFVICIGALVITRIPRPAQSAEGRAARGSLRHELRYSWGYIRARPGLFGMLIYSALTTAIVGVVPTLLTPLILGFATVRALGLLATMAGVGLLLGSLLISVWGGPRHKMAAVFGFSLLQGLLLLLGGLQPSLPLIAIAATLFMAANPLVIGCGQAIWQAKVAPDLQGRVLALRQMATLSTLPLAYLSAGPLVDRVFEPALAPGGALAPSVGALIGVGKGRGIGLLFMLMGLFVIGCTAIFAAQRAVRLVEHELPDAVGDQLPSPAAPNVAELPA